MKKFNYIYKITNLANCKIYIGKHSTDKMNDHYMGSGKLLKKAQSKYGIENFTKEIIAYTDNEDSLNFLERFYIRKYGCRDLSKAYNLTDGGEGSQGWKITPEISFKMSQAHLGKVPYMKGKHHTKEVIDFCRNIMVGRKWYNNGIEEVREYECPEGFVEGRLLNKKLNEMLAALNKKHPSMLGKHHSEETKQKISNSRKGLILSQETRQKISENNKGKKRLKYKWLTPEGEIKIMTKFNAHMHHPEWIEMEVAI